MTIILPFRRVADRVSSRWAGISVLRKDFSSGTGPLLHGVHPGIDDGADSQR
jgi:hypothetical protein